jgi:hypothetical protein
LPYENLKEIRMKKVDRRAAAVKTLEKNILSCSPFDAFGYDNVEKINIMLDVILLNRSVAWINSTFLTSDELLVSQPYNVYWQSALDARAWVDGTIEIDDLLFPGGEQRHLSDGFPSATSG